MIHVPPTMFLHHQELQKVFNKLYSNVQVNTNNFSRF